MRNAVTVTGSGLATASPDVMRVSLSIQAHGADVAMALDTASAAMGSVLDVLRARGIADVDVSTANLSVQEAWGPSGQVTGYQCSQQLQVVVRDVDASGALLRALAEAGGDNLRINDVSLDVSDKTEAAVVARAAAFADARARADQYAALAGRGLGAVVSVEESERGERFEGGAMRAVSLGYARKSMSVPVAQGQLQVQITVQVKWSLLG